METREEVKVFRINCKCENCLTGNMIGSGNRFNGVAYEHKCDQCGYPKFLNIKYPIIEYEPITLPT